MAPAETGWKVAFNAQDTSASETYGIGFATAGGSATTSVVWLTSTDGTTERDPVLARLGAGTPERYLVGWRTQYADDFVIGVITADGTFIEGPEQMSASGPRWGQRDDSFRSVHDGSVAWLEGASGSSTLDLHRFASGIVFADAFESGSTDGWSSSVN
jgi:hypothetical protein